MMKTVKRSSIRLSGLALALLLLPASASGQATHLEDVIHEEARKALANALGEEWKPGDPAPDRLEAGLARLGREKAGLDEKSLHFTCIPTCDVTDGRFLAIASDGLITLSDPVLELHLGVPAGTTQFTLGVFDGDGSRPDGAGENRWDTGSQSNYVYTLFADPLADGVGMTPVDLDPLTPDVFELSTAFPNDAWKDFTVDTDASAEAPSGNFFYRLRIELQNPATTAINLNAFKVRTDGVVTVEVFEQPFSYISTGLGSLPDAEIVFPDFPNRTPTTYDGDFTFYFERRAGVGDVVIFDGDFDLGKFDGDRACAPQPSCLVAGEQDTDDPDTPNVGVPPFATGDAVPEGVADGFNGTTGNPSDDLDDSSSLGFYAVRAPSVRYELTLPDGVTTFANENPTGNQEWEQFRIALASDPDPKDFTASELPFGTYTLHIDGVDMLNLNALRFPSRVLCVDIFGVACTALKPFLVGDTVFYDIDGNGVQDAGEPGISGVTVDLIDTASGDLIASTTTDGDGNYSFEVDAADYTLEVAAESFDPGGALEGFVNTTPTTLTDTVVDDNVLTFDFGFRGTGSIGNAVWYDVDGDGVEDSGEPGIDGVTVTLEGDLDGDGTFDFTLTTVTATVGGFGGFYEFTDLPPADYRVTVDPGTLPAGLDAPTFDADGTGTPHTAELTLGDGEDNPDVDFGYTGSGSIGNRVWLDANANALQDDGATGLNGLTVDLVALGSGTTFTTTTSGDGEYAFPNLPADTYTVTVSGLPAGLFQTFDVDGLGTPDAATVVLGAGQDRDDVDFGYDVICGLAVEKTCQVVPEPGSFVCSDAKPLDVLTMIWNGATTVDVKAWKGSVGSTLLATVTGVAPGGEVSVPGYAGSPNDVFWEVFATGGGKIGESKFHLSCSDDAMDGPEDCGSAQGDGKGNDAGFLNDWRLEGLAGNGQELDCTPTPAPPAAACETRAKPAPSCESLDKPTSLTFEYTGGSCLASDNDQGDKTDCSGTVDGAQPATISVVSGLVVTPSTVSPGEEFTVSGSFGSNTVITVTNGGGAQVNEVHTSCSAPLATGDVFGALTLNAFSGQRDGSPVIYAYEVSNTGAAVTGLTLFDDQLGPVGGPVDLPTGATETFSVEARVAFTTVNVVDVEGGAFGDVCTASDSAVVTVTGRCEPVPGELDFNDKEIRLPITNTGILDLVISKITVTWPAANGDLDEIKRDGDAIHKGDFPPTSAVVSSGWEGNPDKRTIQVGDTDTLKVKFKNTAVFTEDTVITVEFEQSCSLTRTFQAPISGGDFACAKPIDALTMIWDGAPADVLVTAWKGDVGGTKLVDQAPVTSGGELTVSGLAGSPNDVFWEIFAPGGTKLGESKFHLSCSDDDMNGPEDCGKRQGDAKGSSGFVNDWILEGMVDSQTLLDCTAGGGPSTGAAQSRVSSGADDVEERLSDGDVYVSSTDLELVNDSSRGDQLVGMRFRNLAIPQGATITSASIEFETDETDGGATSLTFRGEAADDAAPFVDVAFDVSNRDTTAASVAWSPPPWTTTSEKHQTPDLSAVLQEIVDRAGWTSGNAVVIVVSGSGERTAESYDGEPENAPLLRVTFTTP